MDSTVAIDVRELLARMAAPDFEPHGGAQGGNLALLESQVRSAMVQRADAGEDLREFNIAVFGELDPIVTLQSIDDNKKRSDKRLAQTKHGRMAGLWPWIQEMQAKGCGIYVTVNETDGSGTRRAENITKVRAVGVDMDTPELDNLGNLSRFPRKPQAVVCSSPGKYQAWWLLADAPLDAEDNRVRARSILTLLHGDKTVHDLPRVLRLPGTLHQKNPNNPHYVFVVATCDHAPYTVEEFDAAIAQFRKAEGLGTTQSAPPAGIGGAVRRTNTSSHTGHGVHYAEPATFPFPMRDGERYDFFLGLTGYWCGQGLGVDGVLAKLYEANEMNIALGGDRFDVAKMAVRAQEFRDKDAAKASQAEHLLGRLTEARVAEDISTACQNLVGWVPSLGSWIVWRNGWVAGRGEVEIHSLIKDELRKAQRMALDIADPEKRLKAMTFYTGMERAQKLAALASLLRKEAAAVVDHHQIDARGEWLHVENGYIDLLTLELHQAEPRHMLMKRADVKFENGATAPKFEEFVRTVMGRAGQTAEELATKVAYVQEVAGSILRAGNPQQMIYLLYGMGSNGKSTFVDLIRRAAGTYAVTLATNSLSQTAVAKVGVGAARADLIPLVGARGAFVNELPEGVLALEFLKAASGGDPLKARALYGAEFAFRPEFTLIITSNYKPIITETGEAAWRRFRLVGFHHRFDSSKADREFADKVWATESAGILNWMLEGLDRLRSNGWKHTPCIEIDRDTAEWRRDLDIVQAWADECVLNLGKDDTRGRFTPTGALYTSFKRWCASLNKPCKGSNAFAADLRRMGWDEGRTNRKTGFCVMLADPLDDVAPEALMLPKPV